MSSTTWTRTAVAFSAKRAQFELWRAVEAQHQIATLALVDTVAEQRLLEELLEASKPKLPPAAARLHYLLFTPFRYPPWSHGSRFRAATDPGVFYGADAIRTACAELGYWRWRFLMDALALKALEPKLQTVFQAAVDTATINLMAKPFVRDRALWTDPNRYEGTQAFARVAREAAVGAVRYESVRDCEHGPCGAILTPTAFAQSTALAQQSWWLAISRERVAWRRESIYEFFEFDPRQQHHDGVQP